MKKITRNIKLQSLFIAISILFIYQSLALAQNRHPGWKVFIIGNGAYNNKNIPDLRNSINDAVCFKNFFLSNTGGALDSTQIFCDTNLTHDDIYLKSQSFIKVVQKNDTVFIFYSGHGQSTTKRDHIFDHIVPVKAYSQKEDAGDISGLYNFRDFYYNLIEPLLSNSSCYVLFFTDMCRSGIDIDTTVSTIIDNEIAQTQDLKKKFIWFSSSLPSQQSYILNTGFSSFTLFLLKGLYGFAKGEPQFITIGDLRNYITNKWNNFLDSNRINITDPNPIQNPYIYYGNAFSGLKLSIVDTNSINIAKKLQNGIKNIASNDVNLKSGKGIGSNYKSSDKVKNIIDKIYSEIKMNKLIEPKDSCAYYYYTLIKDNADSNPNVYNVGLDLAAKMLNNSQEVINIYLSGGNDQPAASKFLLASKEIKCANLILGNENYFKTNFLQKQLFLEAFSIIKSNDARLFDSAQVLLNKCIEMDSTAAYAYNALGRLFENRNIYDKAELYTRKAIIYAPTWNYPRVQLGNIYSDQNQFELARIQYDSALEISKYSSWFAYNNKGCTSETLGRYRESEIYFRKADSLYSGRALVARNIGVSLENQGRIADAESKYKESIMKNEDYLDAKYALCDLYINDLKRYNLADSILRNIIKSYPNEAKAYKYMGDLFSRNSTINNNRDSAKYYYLKVLNIDSMYEYAYYGLANLTKEDFEKENIYQKCITLFNNRPSSYRHYAEYLKSKDMNTEAENNYKISIDKDSLDLKSYNSIISYYSKTNQEDKAMEWIDTMFSIYNFKSSSLIYLIKGDYLYGKNRYEDAINAYKQCIETDPLNIKPYFNLGFIASNINRDLEESIFRYSKFIEQNPQSDKKNFICSEINKLSDSNFKAGNLDIALKGFEFISELNISLDNKIIKESIARIYYLQNQLEYAKLIVDTILISNEFEVKSKIIKSKVYELVGLILIDENQPDDAIKMFDSLYYYNKSNFVSKLGKAICYYIKNDMNNSKIYFDLALQDKNYSENNIINSYSYSYNFKNIFNYIYKNNENN